MNEARFMVLLDETKRLRYCLNRGLNALNRIEEDLIKLRDEEETNAKSYDLLGDDGRVIRTVVLSDAGEVIQDTQASPDGGHFELVQREDLVWRGGRWEKSDSSRLLPDEGGTE